MVENYITLSLETHLFFSRIMKEHSLFLEAGFPCKNKEWIEKADYFRQQFEELLADVVRLSNERVNAPILQSDELVTDFTVNAERQTECLSGIPINSEITELQDALCPGVCRRSRNLFMTVHRINNRALFLLNGMIEFKEAIQNEVENGRLFTANYPLLIKHIIREARLYQSTVSNLMRSRQISYRDLWGTEEFWNRIMMEHALFIRGLLDPSEEVLITTANNFAIDYQKLLDTAKTQDCIASHMFSEETLEETLRYREFKEAGTKGILNCKIASIILPLLADHVLREANHYIRILKCAAMREDG